MRFEENFQLFQVNKLYKIKNNNIITGNRTSDVKKYIILLLYYVGIIDPQDS